MRKTVCLNMIVKNERSAIQNCLESVKGIIDTWVIADTGSSDGTQEAIRETLKDLPGELHEIEWTHFAESRNKALQLALGKADYILFIDADEEIVVQEGFSKESLEKDAYFIRTKGPVADHFRLLLIRNDPRWRWEGALHEHLVHESAKGEVLPTLVNLCKRKDGRRSQDPDKFLHDAQKLQEMLLENPDHPRILFYLAQSYGNGMEFALALHYYQRRAAFTEPPEETFWALYCIGHMQEHLNHDLATILGSFCRAYTFDPTRAEPLERIANQFLQRGWPLLSYLVARFGLDFKEPLVVQSNVHSWVYQYALRHLTERSASLLKSQNFFVEKAKAV